VFGGLSGVDASRQQCTERASLFARADRRGHSVVERLPQQRMGKFRNTVRCANDSAGEEASQRLLRVALDSPASSAARAGRKLVPKIAAASA